MTRQTRFGFCSLIALIGILAVPPNLRAQVIADYTAYPPSLTSSVPPLVMLVMSRDHRLFIKAYNDFTDVDGDGAIDATYKDTITYAGYFDPNKCYGYVSNRFEPQAAATGANSHYCSARWSGNFLNWATMARIDIMRKVLYGGKRKVDTTTATVLSRTVLPSDSHSWAKVYTGSDISSLTPNAWSSITICNTNTNASETSSLIRVANGNYPYTAVTESSQAQCTLQVQGGAAVTWASTYNADVLVCVSSMLEGTCQTYTDSGGTNYYKPTGLMQQLGVDRQGTATTADDVTFMRFGLISGSWGAHVSGGVLRSNIVDVNSEIDPATGVVAATSKIIKNIDQFRISQWDYSIFRYNGTGVLPDNCRSSRPVYPQSLPDVSNKVCRDWGNPVGEMLYETIRYFQGKSGPTAQFQQATPDEGLTGLTVASPWTDPYGANPTCSRCFALILSDPFPSFDSDELPGSYWPKAIGTSDTPSVQTLVANANMNTLEGIGSVFIGHSAATFNGMCSPKAGNFASIRGLCVEEPSKQGSYYIAGLAHYAQTTDLRGDKTGIQSMTTYAVMANSPFPDLEFTVAGKKARIVPSLHSGCPQAGYGSPGYTGCTAQGTNGNNESGEIVSIQLCANDSDWTTEQGNGYTSCYDIVWNDTDFGIDFDLDVHYRIYVKTNSGAGTITLKTKGRYAGASNVDYVGYFIDGVTGGGQFLDVACGGDDALSPKTGAGSNDCDRYNAMSNTSGGTDDGMANSASERTFTVVGSTAGVLKSPLWYAAKYGGFIDQDGSNTPNLQAEWDTNNDGDPDTYFYAQNPLQLEQQLNLAFVSIMSRSSAGSSVSVLATSSTGEGAVYQTYFYPSVFDSLNQVKWVGYAQSLFVDTFGNFREDSDGDGRLVYQSDKIVNARYDNNPSSSTYGNVLVDRFVDANGDGKADSTTPVDTQLLKNILPLWEAGKQLALKTPASRNVITWVDSDNDGVVDAGEQIAFSTANAATLGPYLRAGAAPYDATSIVNFVRGTQVSGLRNRQVTVSGTLQVWKLGDPVAATPVVVGAPRERFDVIYGDSSYTAFYAQYKNRRQMAYVGANDGVFHAFNAGYYHRGDDPSTSSVVEHGWFTRTPTDNSSGPLLGEEKWGFIPYQLHPHLRWLADPKYTHVYYVDLKPKVTDARIFTPDADHPNGWGTILIGGMRLGGSCGACLARTSGGTGAPPMVVNISGTNRTFYSAYFVLDITNPEVDPKLLWSFSDSTLGMTSSYPAVVRANPAADAKTSNTNAKWFMLVGTGATGYDGVSVQTGKMFAVNLATGPGAGNSLIFQFPTSDANSFMGDLTSLDADLDFRADTLYLGNVINNGGSPSYAGKLYRLTTGGGSTSPGTSWGFASGGNRVPTVLLANFSCSPTPCTGSTLVGPVTAAPTVSLDDSRNTWLFFGTGRYYNTADKTNTNTQYFFGVKDPVITGGCSQTSVTSCQMNNVLNVSNATICVVCAGGTTQVTGVAGVTTFDGTATTTLQGKVQSMDGWYTTLPAAGERVLFSPTLIGGTVFFPTFAPVSDVCTASGNGYLYALFYLTGSAYKESVVGTYDGGGGNTNVARSISLGQGISSSMAVQLGARGSGGDGTTGNTGCAGRASLISQTSTGDLNRVCGKPALSVWSRYLSWADQKY